jgi:hypothetical protein
MKPDDRRNDEFEPEDWLAQALEDAPVPAPGAGLRERTRARFLAGAASAAVGGRKNRWPLRLVVTALATAAALLFLLRTPSAPRVELVETAPKFLASASLAEIEGKVLEGRELETGDETARLRLDGVALVELAPRTRLQIRTWEADGSGEAVLELSSGGVRIVTAPDFAPRRLRVITAEAEVSIVGTEFGVDVIENMGTCVCCTHGAIDVRSRIAGDSSRVLEGGMALCFASGAAPMLGEIERDQADVVTALRRYAWPKR